jgi:hypothetical protein
MNNHFLAGSNIYNVGFFDSGTTFTYFPTALFTRIKQHFEWFCKADTKNNCKGAMEDTRSNLICFKYEERDFPNGPKDYFASFPVLKFLLPDIHGDNYEYNWWPSEYMYKERYN